MGRSIACRASELPGFPEAEGEAGPTWRRLSFEVEQETGCLTGIVEGSVIEPAKTLHIGINAPYRPEYDQIQLWNLQTFSALVPVESVLDRQKRVVLSDWRQLAERIAERVQTVSWFILCLIHHVRSVGEAGRPRLESYCYYWNILAVKSGR